MKIKTQKVHILGIGGIGMSGIAEILIRDGHQVSGSDMSESGNTRRLQEMGAKIFIGHEASNIEDVDYCVRSTAIPEDNIEVQTARQRSIPVLRRSEVVADLMKLNKGIAVAGTHGKTTTTSLLSTILIECKMDPTCLIGGIVHRLKSNATRGKGDFFVIEADESDGTFLKFNPVYSIVNNIDNDHLDYYETEEKVDEAFLKFMNNVPFFGRVILNLGDTRVLKVSKCLRRVYTSYGVESDIEEGLSVDFYAHSIKSDGLQTEFKIKHPSGETVV
ncbi:MAG: Mur ligase domain-containing protein, partial [Bacteriovoracaceae bacterium]